MNKRDKVRDRMRGKRMHTFEQSNWERQDKEADHLAGKKSLLEVSGDDDTLGVVSKEIQ